MGEPVTDPEILRLLNQSVEPHGKAKVKAGLHSSKNAPREGSTARQKLRGVFQGATFGFGDEITAGAAAAGAKVLGDESPYGEIYSDIRGAERAEQSQFAQEYPGENIGTQVAGGLLTGLGPVRGAVTAAKTVPGVSAITGAIPTGAKVIGAGAAGGATYGAGVSEEGDRAGGAKQGAIVGAVTGPIGTVVINKLGLPVARAIVGAATRSSRSQANKLVTKALIDSGYTKQQAVDELNRLGADAILADLGGQVRNLARTAQSSPAGEARHVLEEFLTARDLKQQSKLWDLTRRLTHSKGNMSVAEKTINNRQKALSAPLYRSAYGTRIGTTQVLDDALTLPDVQSAFRVGIKQIENEMGRALPKSAKKLTANPSTEQWDWIQRGLRSKATALARAAPDKARPLYIRRNEILKEVDSLNPDFARARSTYAGHASLKEALKSGKDFLKADIDELPEYLTSLTQGEKQAYTIGATRTIRDAIQSPGSQRDISKINLFRSPMAQAKLTMAIGETQAKALLKEAEIQAQKRLTKDLLMVRSPTADIQAGQEAAGKGLLFGAARTAAGDTVGGPVQAVTSLLGSKRLTPGVATELSRILGTPNPTMRGLLPREGEPIITPLLTGGMGGSYGN